MSKLELYLQKKIKDRQLAGNLRQLKIAAAPIDLFSNDYLGLVTTGVLPALISKKYGTSLATGSTGSRLLSGNSVIAEMLEQNIATFHDVEAALLFNSGYDANVGLLSAIADRHTTYIYDELCHASIIDGIRLSQAQVHYKYRHNDIADLQEKINLAKEGPVIVVTESVFSMDGDMAPLQNIAGICMQYNASLVIDEAHATGVFGNQGKGLVHAQSIATQTFARIHTYGKAMGCHGAAVVGSTVLKQYLINFARSFIYTTALPEHTLCAIECAYGYLGSSVYSNEVLHDLVAYFRKQVAGSNIKGWNNSSSPIQALVIGNNERTRHIAGILQQDGLQVNAILSPTVPAGSERLRICLHTFNTYEQIDLLLKILATHL
ncbi:MAG: 8-amino-7-oxononanoate synthase [Taibaiella sp.]|nr:8-amino-7-oxononanoate synthase [Taibaiella sp.]